MPRARALNDAKRREVCALVSAGCSLDSAARYVGCNVVTIRREAFRNPEFHDRLREAQLASQISPLRAMRRAADTHWRAAAWLLERTDPNQFARRNPEQLTPSEIQEAMTYMGEAISSVLPDAETTQRVLGVIESELEAALRAIRAGEKPCRDLRSRRPAPLPPLPPQPPKQPTSALRDEGVDPTSGSLPGVEKLDCTPSRTISNKS